MYLSIFVLASFAELYFFWLQRSALEMSRRHNIDVAVGRHMLPNWYLLVYVVRIAKYGALLGLYNEEGFATALSLLAGSMILTTFAPIPHAHCKRIFEKEVEKLHDTDPMLAAKLTVVLLQE